MDEQVIIVAGGVGSRMGRNEPKQFIKVKGKTILEYTISQFQIYNPTIPIILVVHKDWISEFKNIIKNFENPSNIEITVGGENRFDSVKNGLALIKKDAIIAIHDAARPMVSVLTISNCFMTAQEKGNAIPVIEVKDSIRKLEGDSSKALDRSQYKIVQTPQCFTSSTLLKAYAVPYSTEFTDDASVVENMGEKINLVDGNPENIKITNPMDLMLFESFY